MSDNNKKPASAPPPDTMAAIGKELRLTYAEIIAEECRNVLPRSCASWTMRGNEGETR